MLSPKGLFTAILNSSPVTLSYTNWPLISVRPSNLNVEPSEYSSSSILNWSKAALALL